MAGQINFIEFKTMLASIGMRSSITNMRRAYALFDSDGDGIDLREAAARGSNVSSSVSKWPQ